MTFKVIIEIQIAQQFQKEVGPSNIYFKIAIYADRPGIAKG